MIGIVVELWLILDNLRRGLDRWRKPIRLDVLGGIIDGCFKVVLILVGRLLRGD